MGKETRPGPDVLAALAAAMNTPADEKAEKPAAQFDEARWDEAVYSEEDEVKHAEE